VSSPLRAYAEVGPAVSAFDAPDAGIIRKAWKESAKAKEQT
jgi:hypothetical protein